MLSDWVRPTRLEQSRYWAFFGNSPVRRAPGGCRQNRGSGRERHGHKTTAVASRGRRNSPGRGRCAIRRVRPEQRWSQPLHEAGQRSRRASASSQANTPGEGPIDGAEAYFSAVRTYPADEIPPTISHTAKLTFDAIAKKGDPGNNHWYSYGPKQSAVEPGVLAFSGATNTTASRVTAMVIAPTCTPGNCRLWVGVSGGGVWRTDDALAADPSWTYLTAGIAQNSVGTLTAAPSDPTGNTLYLGTGEANRCSSGCEAGVGIYKSTNGGSSWTKLADSCTSNSTYACVTPGQDAFLGRSISKIVVDPANPNHLYVGSALGVRGLSHVIG